MKILASKRIYEGMAGAWLIVNDGDKFLVARRTPYCKEDIGKWNWIGGGVDDSDESPKHAAIREFKEECNIDFTYRWDDIKPLVSIFNHTTGGMCHFFILSVNIGDMNIKLNKEHDTLKWLPLYGKKGYSTDSVLLSNLNSLNWPTAASLVPLYTEMRSRGVYP